MQSHVINTRDQVNVKLQKKTSLARAVRRVKQSSLPQDPKDLSELQTIDPIYTQLTLNSASQRWLLHFDPDSDEKMSVLSTNRHLKYLSR